MPVQRLAWLTSGGVSFCRIKPIIACPVPHVHERCEALSHLRNGHLVREASRQPGLRGTPENSPPHRETPHQGDPGRDLERAPQVLERRVQAQHEDTAAMWIVLPDQIRTSTPGCYARLRLELPPVWTNAKIVYSSQ